MSSGCLDESLVVAFLGGTLPTAIRDEAEVHIAACNACADLITWAAADIAATASRAPGSEGWPFVGHLTPGSHVGRYQILGAIGRGGMGEVYAAYHPDLDRRIALKVVNESGASGGQRRARLLREARAIARLSHPNVVAVHDAGTLGDRVFIAMEFVDGLTVDEWLRATPRTWQQILDVFVAAGRGLAAAHAAGIVHRDFKPQNVMIGKDGGVHVMDFGLAQLLHEAVAPSDAPGDMPRSPLESVTATGALLGTPAYMSPEQFHRGEIDGRSDQFSFSVALHEALFGVRPISAQGAPADVSTQAHVADAPGWLRAIVDRGAAVDRDRRYASMAELLTAVERGRRRVRRHASVALATLAITLVAMGGWRLAHRGKFVCSLPAERVAAAWPADNADHARRQAIHAAFVASRRATAETNWQRLSATLDGYIRAWGSMYLETCTATHVQGEQSPDVLDLRMSCLNDNLDQVRALTDTLLAADGDVVSRAASAAVNLTPVARCADVKLLKSAVPLPRDERTLGEVERLRRSLADVQALWEVGQDQAALAKAMALRPEVEATGYKPLLAQLLVRIGIGHFYAEEGEETLESAFFTAEAAHDDITAAKAAANLVYVVGCVRARFRDAERWAHLANALLDRAGNDDPRTRAWVFQNYGAALGMAGEFEQAISFFQQAVTLKEMSVGVDHPDVAISLDALAWALVALDRPNEALAATDRAFAIHAKHTDTGGMMFANSLINRGWSLLAVGRTSEARAAFEAALGNQDSLLGLDLADATTGLGKLELAEGRLTTAIPLLENALLSYPRFQGATVFASDARFTLARALWESGRERRRARMLATEARNAYVSFRRPKRAAEVEAWLASHPASMKQAKATSGHDKTLAVEAVERSPR